MSYGMVAVHGVQAGAASGVGEAPRGIGAPVVVGTAGVVLRPRARAGFAVVLAAVALVVGVATGGVGYGLSAVSVGIGLLFVLAALVTGGVIGVVASHVWRPPALVRRVAVLVLVALAVVLVAGAIAVLAVAAGQTAMVPASGGSATGTVGLEGINSADVQTAMWWLLALVAAEATGAFVATCLFRGSETLSSARPQCYDPNVSNAPSCSAKRDVHQL
jgi:hypothetical protein